jgi:hypothetical protein
VEVDQQWLGLLMAALAALFGIGRVLFDGRALGSVPPFQNGLCRRLHGEVRVSGRSA